MNERGADCSALFLWYELWQEYRDVDLLVVAQFQGKPWRFAVEIRERIKASFPLDLLVRTPEQLQERLAKHDMFLTEIISRGTVLYEA